MKRYLIPVLVLIFVLTSGAPAGCSQGQPPYFKAPGEPVHLVNNSAAFDHTWQEVVAFLAWDATDKEAYAPEHMCGFFAEELHNRAEYYGFKTAFIVVEFETDEPHALNAFNTVDYGLVYIDCTGRGRFEAPAPTDKFTELAPVEDWDKVPYIVEGEKMGLISLGYEEENFSYEWYKECRARVEDFEEELDAYNEEVAFFNSQPKPIHYPPRGSWAWVYSREKWEVYLAERDRLIEKRYGLQSEWKEVRGYNWEESDSPVRRIRIYW